MIAIQKIEIQYFRSIYKEEIKGIKHFNIFTGKNDVGKSNILKALNLFFNNETDSGVVLDFAEDFNKKRLTEVRKDSVKGKQFIQIKVTFETGDLFPKTLPKAFTITKKWNRDSKIPTITDDIEKKLKAENRAYNDRSKMSLTKYLARIKYYYIPAIKDNAIFKIAYDELRESIYKNQLISDKEIIQSMSELHNKISSATLELNREFKDVSNIDAMLRSPQNITDLYRTISISTEMDGSDISLDKRGDGIRIRYIPSILNYIAINSSNIITVWGFEEPENSLEYRMAQQLANSFKDEYSMKSQIFISSHSPAFISLEDFDNTQIYRCFNTNNKTKILSSQNCKNEIGIEEELGYIELQKELYKEYNEKIESLKEIEKTTAMMQEEFRKILKPVLLTEGKTDVLILKSAWNKLYDDECPFEIKSCDVFDENSEFTAAGCLMLSNALKTHRHDSTNILIGLFDRDTEGMLGYKLDKNFIENGNKTWKAHKNGKSYAILLPVPDGKNEYEKFENLCIEFYFEDRLLSKSIDGESLVLTDGEICHLCNGKKIGTQKSLNPAHRKIDSSSKINFAEKVVPTFEKVDFAPFEALFCRINEIISTSKESAFV